MSETQLPQPIPQETLLIMYSSFGDEIVNTIKTNEQVADFLRHFPTMEVYPAMVDGVIVPSQLKLYGRASAVAQWAGVNKRSLTQKCANDESMVEYPYATNVSYDLLELIHASQNMGKVSKGRTSFINTALDAWFAGVQEVLNGVVETYADLGMEFDYFSVKEQYEAAVDAGVVAYNEYKAAKKSAKEEEE